MREVEGGSCLASWVAALPSGQGQGPSAELHLDKIFMMKVWHDRNSKTMAEAMMCDWEGGSGSWNKGSAEAHGDLPLTSEGL